ncbi:MAG: 4Fe-4S binding protein [Deltaproteobacteria bacterium]|nr:4Fe-4S binding protein [Deltaproteobacteria bacterium]
MSVRKIVKIDENLCNGCGECVPSCAEGAIKIIDGKARLSAENLCDGLGACLGDCPMGAITLEERDADDFDEAEVEKIMKKSENRKKNQLLPIINATSFSPMTSKSHGGGGCPGSRSISFNSNSDNKTDGEQSYETGTQPSELTQWPVQMHLISPVAPYFQNSDVLLAADCVAFSVGDFHRTWLKGKALAIACPKLDDGQDTYLKKLVSMIDDAKINTLTVMIMEVPCCGGLIRLASQAVESASRKIPIKKIVVSIRGELLLEQWI